MKKFSKILLIIIACIIVLTPAIIPISNNVIANKVKNELKSLPLPTKTELVDSVSIAGKIIGNGNGMQYFGAILINSDLDEEDLLHYYSAYSDKIKITKQENEKITCDEIHTDTCFKNFSSEKPHYIVYTWGEAPSGLFSGLLNLDLRGH